MVTASTMSTHLSGDAGYPALPIDAVLAPHADIVSRIKLCYGADRLSFEADILSLIRSYAAYVHLLPATPNNYFSKPGGLLRLGLDAGFFSLQGTDAHIFSGRSTITTRRQLEPRWRHATFIAGMCCELHRTLSHMVVEAPSGETWSGYLQPLAEWLSANGVQNYGVSWRPQAQETRSLGLFALPHVVPSPVLHYLSEKNTIILPHLMASITGLPLYRDHNILDQLVRRSLALVIDCNLCANADRLGSPQLGAHLGRYLIEALQRLASSNAAWTCNGDKSRVWYSKDGLFLLWPNAAEDVKKLLESEQLPGIPREPDPILMALLAADVIEAHDDKHVTWDIWPPGTKAPVKAIKLRSAAILFAGMSAEPEALGVQLIQRPDTPTSPPKPPPSPTPLSHPSQPTPQSGSKSGEQMNLIPAASESVPPPKKSLEAFASASASDSTATNPPAEPVSAAYSLQAPMRLHPATRDALLTIIQSLHSETAMAQACLIAQGLFVPLDALERQGLQPFHALRTLTEVGMLVASDNAPTLSLDFNGMPTIGLVIAVRFIGGIQPCNDSDPTEEGGAHAA